MTSLEQIIGDIAAGLEEQKAGTASLLEAVAAEAQQVLEKIAKVQATVDGEAAAQLGAIKETIENNNAAILAAKSAVESIVVVPAVPEEPVPPVEPPSEPVVVEGEE